MMSHDFGFYIMQTFELPRRFYSPGVLPSLGDRMETLTPTHPNFLWWLDVDGYVLNGKARV